MLLRKTRILLITASYHPKIGGLETVVGRLAAEFKRQGYQVMVLTHRFPRGLPGYEKINGVPVRRIQFLYPKWSYLTANRGELWLAGLLFFPLTLIQLFVILFRFQPDVVNLHYVGSQGLFLWLAHRLFRFRLVVSLHGGDVECEPHLSRTNRWVFTTLLRRAVRVTACSQMLLNQALILVPEIASKATVIHNGVEVQLFSQAHPFSHPRPYLAAIGQLAPHKGFDCLITAFAQVASQIPEIDLLLAGQGPEQASLQEQVHVNGLTRRIQLVGAVAPKQVAALMKGSQAIIIPSRRDAFGLVGLEAMASGRPIIASCVGGLTEALAGGVVTWVEPDNPAELATALVQVCSQVVNPHSSLLANQQQAQTYAWPQICTRYLDLLLP